VSASVSPVNHSEPCPSRSRLRETSRRAALIALSGYALIAGGCDVVGRISGAYRGPVPARDPIVEEVVIVRKVGASGEVVLFVADRVRYLEAGKPHDVNRVVRVQPSPANQEEVAALGLAVGDRVTISTSFAGIGDAAEMTEVPDWPGHGFYEYPIAVHVVTSIRRTSP
jgi:hypothetical protein